ncbi:MAG: hypothetical protein IPM51_07030 [Sphingobacteriaceae bacterium]|nr:hypothetical protein [Sphingobacteriaceae bacterium]
MKNLIYIFFGVLIGCRESNAELELQRLKDSLYPNDGITKEEMLKMEKRAKEVTDSIADLISKERK